MKYKFQPPQPIDTLFQTYDRGMYKITGDAQFDTMEELLTSNDSNANNSSSVVVDAANLGSGTSSAVTNTVGVNQLGNIINYTPAAGATLILDCSSANDQRITMPAGNITLTLNNATISQKFTVSITQDSTGSRTVTWFPTIRWSDGVAPILSTDPQKRDTFGFICTGNGTYDGFVIGLYI